MRFDSLSLFIPGHVCRLSVRARNCHVEGALEGCVSRIFCVTSVHHAYLPSCLEEDLRDMDYNARPEQTLASWRPRGEDDFNG